MKFLLPYIPLLLKGSLVTLVAWIIASIGSLTLGTFLGVLGSRPLSKPVCSALIRWYAFVTKGVPAYVQILIAYFVIPSLVGFSLSGFTAATGALILCSSGYVTEIVRSGINAIPQGQWDACFVLGYSKWHALRRVVAPQVLRLSTPILLGECEQLLKSTSLMAAIGVTELTRTGMNIISRELNPLPIYLTVAGMYLLFAACINLAILVAEKRKKTW